MDDDNDDDVPLLLGSDDEQLITAEDTPPNVEAIFVVTFDVKFGKNIIENFLFIFLFYDFSR